MGSGVDILEALSVFGPDEHREWRDGTNSQRLCARCSATDWEPAQLYLAIADEYSFYPRVPVYSTHPLLHEVRHSAYGGCHLCTLILTALITMRYRYSIGVDPLPEGLREINDETRIEVNVEAMAKRPPVWLTVGISNQGSLSGWHDMSLPILSNPPEINHEHTPRDAGTMARGWLAQCLENHTKCSTGLPQLPRRVINVSMDPLRLEEPGEKHAQYATLSYSIGGAHLCTTTSKNLNARKDGFSIKELPRIAQDAVWWTRQLGLDYLWLDSLCILQDNLGDWEVELSTMADIYQNATLTLAATRATSALESCLPSQNTLTMIPCRMADGVVVTPDYGRANWIFLKGHLDTRAWCFQEVQLSTRVLRVGGEELAWQCRQCKRLQREPEVERVHDIEANMPFFGSRALDARIHHSDRPFRLWYTLVLNFGRRNLTYPEDRLPAFSGMAQHFQQMLNGTYLAGLWKEDLMVGLLWRMEDPGRFSVYRGPSWSWASVEGGFLGWVLWLFDATDFMAEVLDVRTRVSGLNPYGRVTAGKLSMAGKLTPLPPFLLEDDSEIGPVDWREYLIRWDRQGRPGIGTCLFRMHKMACLILQPVQGRPGVWTRIGVLVTAVPPHDRTILTVGTLDGYEWRNDVVSIL